MCFYCKSGELRPGVTNYVLSLGASTVVIKNVPCEECDECGETFFSTPVMLVLDKIMRSMREVNSEVTVLDYNSQRNNVA